MPEMVRCLVYTLGGYLSGNIMYAYWLPRRLRGVDVRDYGSDHNPGAANATLACGLPVGVACALLDILKGTIPVALALHVGKLPLWYMVPVVVAPVAGHAWPVLFDGKGGKAIATGFGVLIGLLPGIWLAPLWAAIILVCLPFIHDHRVLMVVTSALLMVGSLLVYPMPPVRLMACGVAGIIMVRHCPPRVNLPEAEPMRAAARSGKDEV